MWSEKLLKVKVTVSLNWTKLLFWRISVKTFEFLFVYMTIVLLKRNYKILVRWLSEQFLRNKTTRLSHSFTQRQTEPAGFIFLRLNIHRHLSMLHLVKDTQCECGQPCHHFQKCPFWFTLKLQPRSCQI